MRTLLVLLNTFCTLLYFMAFVGMPQPAIAAQVIDDAALAQCDKVTRKEQLILERRALGGDQRAQFMLAHCSWEKTTEPENTAKKLAYAYFWVTLANCERRYDDLDKPDDTLAKTEIPSLYLRYRKDRDYRREYETILEKEAAELQRIKSEIEDAISSQPLDLMTTRYDLRQQVSEMLVAKFNAMGMSGLVPLAMMRNCLAYPGFQQRYVRAGLWQQIGLDIEDAFWINDTDAAPTLDAMVSSATQDIGQAERREIDRFARTYGIGRQGMRARREAAAIGKMGQMPVETLQFALGAFRKSPAYPNGINLTEALKVDGLYGTQTARLVKEAQKQPCVIRDVAVYEGTFRHREATTEGVDASNCFGQASDKDEGTGWLTPLQSRALICRAAVTRNDPFSYMHLAYMFINEIGYPEDIDRALFAVQRATSLFSDPSTRLQVIRSPSFPTESALVDHYKLLSKRLEQDIYWAAAKRFFGEVRPSPDAQVSDELKNSIHQRLSRANYDGAAQLCRDEEIGYLQKRLQSTASNDSDTRFATLRALNEPEPTFGELRQPDFPISILATTRSDPLSRPALPDTTIDIGLDADSSE